jgi:hypothetical protein
MRVLNVGGVSDSVSLVYSHFKEIAVDQNRHKNISSYCEIMCVFSFQGDLFQGGSFRGDSFQAIYRVLMLIFGEQARKCSFLPNANPPPARLLSRTGEKKDPKKRLLHGILITIHTFLGP